MLLYLVFILAALLISLLCTPLVRKLATHYQIVALPNHRTIHTTSIPKLGGLSIWLSFTIGLTLFAIFTENSDNFLGLWVSGTGVLIIGLLDDISGLGCYLKLIGQTLAAIIAVYFGFMIDTVYLPWGISINLGFWAMPLSVFWIVSITNALNLLDGLDGLASGFAIVVSLFIAIGAVMMQHYHVAVITFALMAACAGFLKYNFTPAKIFMGDTGSLFLGFTLGCLSLKAFSSPAGINFQLLIILFSLPLADTTLAVFRRISQKKHPFSPDKKHIHHRLLEMGFNQTTAMLIINIVACICGLVSLVLIKANFQLTFILLLGFCLFVFAFIRQLGCFDFLYKNNGNSEKITDVAISPKENYLAKQMFNSGGIAEKFLATSAKHPARPNKRGQDT